MNYNRNHYSEFLYREANCANMEDPTLNCGTTWSQVREERHQWQYQCVGMQRGLERKREEEAGQSRLNWAPCVRIANSFHEESADVSWVESSWFAGDGIWLLWPAWTHHNLLNEGFATQKENSFIMISLTESIVACSAPPPQKKPNNQMQSLGRVRKVDILLIKITPFPLFPYF